MIKDGKGGVCGCGWYSIWRGGVMGALCKWRRVVGVVLRVEGRR